MHVVRPRSREEFARILEDARRSGRLVYVSAHPCPECEAFEAALEELGVDTSKMVKVDVPDEDWAVDYVLNELGVSGAPSVLTPDGETLDDFDPVELARKVKKYMERVTR